MSTRPQLRLCFIAASGSGKSTAAQRTAERLRARGLTVEVLKLATPLYEAQRFIYELCSRPLDEAAQDHRLLEAVADHMRRIDAEAIVRRFLAALAASTADVVINDDLRDYAADYPRLVAAGFKFIKVSTSRRTRARRMALRGDLSSIVDSKLDLDLARMRADYVLVNEADEIAAFHRAVDHLADFVAGLGRRAA